VAGESYDYMIGLIITGMLFISAVIVVPNLSYVNLLYVDQQQLRNTALEALKAMLLDPGYPPDWGSQDPFDEGDIQRFGLAHASSDSFYILNPDKVSRLVLDNPAGHVGYETIRDRLKLQGYGFNLRIISPFNVTVNDGGPVDLTTMRSGVRVLVAHNNDGRPIPNAVVKTKILYTKSKDSTQFYWAAPVSNTTDALGRCMIKNVDPDFQTANVFDFILVLTVTVADLATITATYMQGFHQQVANASIIGDTVKLWIPENAIPNEQPMGERRIMNVVSVTMADVSNIYTGGDPTEDKMTWGSGYSYWTQQLPWLSYEEPSFLIFNVWVSLGHGQGRPFVLFLGPGPSWRGCRVLNYGGTPQGTTARVQRNVIISGMTYLAEMILWKESL